MGKKKKTAVLYCRVGSGNQVEFLLESQQRRLEHCAKEAGLKIVDIISDMGSSSVCMERPGWNWVLEAARQRKMQVMLVDAGDRISRNFMNLHNEVQKLNDLGVLTYSLKNDFFMAHISRLALKINGGTDMRKISTEELRTMKDIEGLVIQGCGGDLSAWINGINAILTKQGILQNGSAFKNVSVFEHDGCTNLLFHMDDVDLDMGKLAMWRLATNDQFGSTWLSDYLPNQFGVNMDDKPIQRKKPDCLLIGQDGNIYELMGIASRTLKDNGLGEQATEMWDRVTSCCSYGEALFIIGEYVNITSVGDAHEQSGDFKMEQSY